MGVWDFFHSSADSFKRNAPDLESVKGTVAAAAVSLKQKTPDLASATTALRNSYDYGCSAASWAGSAVGVQRLNQYLPGDESRGKIGELATNVAKNAADYAIREGVKALPGGGIAYDIVSKSIPKDEKSGRKSREQEAWEAVSEKQKLKMEALEARLAGLEKELQGNHRHIKPDEPQLRFVATPNPQNGINLLMLDKFKGARLLNTLIIPGAGSKIASSESEAED